MNFEMIWKNIQHCEGETFKTSSGIKYSYTFYNSYILVNNDKKRRISKESFKDALLIENPTPSKIGDTGHWGSSYIYGLIKDSRIKSF